MPNEWSKTLRAHLELVKAQVKLSCEAAHRDEAEIELVAVSKGHDFAKIKDAYDLGLRHFGESYVKELSLKQDLAQAAGLKDIKWHFIGAIQTNKIKLIAAADYVHSVGSVEHARVLSNAASKVIQLFLQVNLSGASGRQGFSENEIPTAWEQISIFNNLHILGLMTIVPLAPLKPNNYWFSRMGDLQKKLPGEVKLSMGMSSDFEEAIMAGAHYIRVGERIFGPRSIAK